MTTRSTGQTRSSGRVFVALGLLVLAFALFVGLGTWQLQRRVWKLDLIARVEYRAHAPPVSPPGPGAWPTVNANDDAYRRVRISGVFANDRETLVQAVTEWGPGYWVLTPLHADAGFTVLINRGFVPAERAAPAARAAGQPKGPVTVTGLLRLSEPKGGFLRANDPAGGRWYSRDVSEIATARGLTHTAPYFIDADAAPNPGGWPLGGLTVITFPNSHLIYAIIWYSLAVMTLGGGFLLMRDERQARSISPAAPESGPDGERPNHDVGR